MAKKLMDSRLHEIRRLLGDLRRLVDDRINHALIALKDPHFAIASNTEEPDDEVSLLGEQLKEAVAITFVLHSPVATEHRFLLAVLSMTVDLEHMADYAKQLLRIAAQTGYVSRSLELLASSTQRKASACFRALYLLEGAEMAQVESLASGRQELEELFEHVLGDLAEMSARPSSPRELEAQVLMALDLKRISDATANIADELVFFNTGSRIAFGQLLEVAVKMPAPELERFMGQLMALRTHQRAPRLSDPESELLVKINQGVPAELQNRYDELVAKRQKGHLTEAEYTELLALTEQVEELDARRVGYLAELARLRNTNLKSIMQDLGIAPPPYG